MSGFRMVCSCICRKGVDDTDGPEERVLMTSNDSSLVRARYLAPFDELRSDVEISGGEETANIELFAFRFLNLIRRQTFIVSSME